MDEVSGSGSAELQDDGSLEIAFAYHLGDETTLGRSSAFFNSPVKPLGRIVRLQHALNQVEMVMRLAADGALETTVEQALMRGLVTA